MFVISNHIVGWRRLRGPVAHAGIAVATVRPVEGDA